MNRQKLTELVNHPEKISQRDMALLSDMAAQYPYATVIQILLAKSKQQQPDGRQALATAALYTPNRQVLRLVMENSLPPLSSSNVPDWSGPSEEEAPQPTSSLESQPTEDQPATSFSQKSIDNSPAQSNAAISSSSNTSSPVSEDTAEDQPRNAGNVQEFSLSLNKTAASAEPIIHPDAPPAPTRDVFEELQQNLRRLREERSKWRSEQQVSSQDQKHISDPLQRQADTSFEKSPRQGQMPPAIQQVVEDHQQQPLENPKVQEQRNLIDSFLQNASNLQRKKNMAAESEDEVTDLTESINASSQGLATETLAKIMERQGKTEKAIDIYQKLLLKFPQKSTYFANCIERLKKDL